MGKMARNKGARGEREVIELLQPIVDAAYAAAGLEPPKLKRTSSTQADGGGCDVCGIDWLALECKWDESYQVDAWWRQCLAQAKPGQFAVLIYKKNHIPWKARCCVHIALIKTTVVADLGFNQFCMYFYASLQLYLQQRSKDNATV